MTNYLFEADYSDSPKLPSPWQLRYKILIKNKKMIMEPSAGLSFERALSKNGFETDGDFGRNASDYGFVLYGDFL